MATVRNGGHKALKVSRVEAEKENEPPSKGTKRIASITSLFDKSRNLRHKTNEGTAADPSSPKHMDKKASNDGFFSRFSSKRKAEEHPLYRSFADAADAYQQGAAASGTQQVEPVYQELTARTNGLDIHGRPLDTPGVPTNAEIEALDAEDRALSEPLGKEKIEVQIRQPDGSMRRKHVTLEASVKAGRHQFEKKSVELDKLVQELTQLDKKIATAHDDALKDKDGSLKRADDKLQAKLEEISKMAQRFKDLDISAIEQALDEDKTAAAETNRKIQAFMAALQ